MLFELALLSIPVTCTPKFRKYEVETSIIPPLCHVARADKFSNRTGRKIFKFPLDKICRMLYDEYYINQKYTTFSGTVFLRYDVRTTDTHIHFEIYGDGYPLYDCDLTGGVLPQEFHVDISGVEKLTIQANSGYNNYFIALSDAVLTYE